MRSPHSSSLFAMFSRVALLTLGLVSLSMAQTPTQPPAQPAATTAPEASRQQPEQTNDTNGRQNQKIERIHVEDSNAKVDELRVGGQVQNITVTPKGDMPAYEVLPNSSGPSPDGAGKTNAGGTGPRVWNVLKF